MNWHEIINQTAKDKEIKSICKKIGGNLSDDLYQELMVIILEYPKEKLVEIYNKGYFKFFIVRTLTNQFNSNSSPFNKLYRLKEIEELPTFEYDKNIDVLYHKVNNILDKLHWYDRELFKAYIEAGSYRKLSKITDIPFNSISRTINHVKSIIRNNLN